MPGLDPGIHDESQQPKALRKTSLWHGFMDCRVKPGNDGGKAECNYACEMNFTFM